MLIYYMVMAALSLLSLISFIFMFREKKLNYYILFMMMLMAISNIANLALAVSQTVEAILITKKVFYLTGCFLPPLMLLVILNICNFKVKNYVRNLLFLFSFIVYGMVLTIGYIPFYYKSFEIVTYYGVSVIEPVYGVGHTFFYVLLYGYLLAGVVILIFGLLKKDSFSIKNLWILLGMDVATIVLFLAGRLLMPHAEIMPLVYVLDGWIFMYLGQHISIYSVEDAIVSSLDKNDKDGYILFDNNRNFLRCSSYAQTVLPDLATCKIDDPLADDESLKFIDDWLIEHKDDETAVLPFEIQGKHYEANVDKIWYAKKQVGYIVKIQDCTDRWNYTQLLSNYNSELEHQVQEKTEHISTIQQYMVIGMANMVENRDNNTGGHIKRTSGVIRILVDTIQKNRIMNLDKQFCRDLIKAAPMHDLGKIGIDDKILRKPGRLTEEEFAIMQTHAEKSEALVKGILAGIEEEHFVEIAVNVARHHHEKWNGKGYPDGLAGDEIPLEARIMAIADVYDALVSKRCYKEAMSFEQAYEVMKESMGTHFDPKLEQMFELSRDKLELFYKNN